jgi:hypothetical protein
MNDTSTSFRLPLYIGRCHDLGRAWVVSILLFYCFIVLEIKNQMIMCGSLCVIGIGGSLSSIFTLVVP